MSVLSAMAVPSKRGVWKTLKLADGTEVRACLRGDENFHFWLSDDGQKYVAAGDVYAPIENGEAVKRANVRRAARAGAQKRVKNRIARKGKSVFRDVKKGLIVLVQFRDKKFSAGNDRALFDKIANGENYREGNFVGSVSDYFKAQSNGQFELDFDVVGPYTLKNKKAYYGGNDSDGDDSHPVDMIVEACNMADADVNFADYDWDGDGEAEQVFVIYAGYGEADSDDEDAVWPHMYAIQYGNDEPLNLDNTVVDTYACSNEIDSHGKVAGIGTICHEFSHCMGFPDFYDIFYEGNFGMSSFDLMDGGAYNGNGFSPAGYTAYEKMVCGWTEPVVLDGEDVAVRNVKPMSEHGDTYIIYNSGNSDEYFMIENRQLSGFDAEYPANGLMVTHVDYDAVLWEENVPNSTIDSKKKREYGYTKTNDHMRMTIVHADNDDDSKHWDADEGYYEEKTYSTDLYPYKKNDSISATSKPAPTYYSKNRSGSKKIEWAITNITQNSDGTMNFDYRAKKAGNDSGDDVVPAGDYIFYESFNQCDGTGGNDGEWSGGAAGKTTTFTPDNTGWSEANGKAYGGNQCARFGASKSNGVATSPSFVIDGTVNLTFKAGAWDGASDGTTLTVEADNAVVTPSKFSITKGEWTKCSATVSGSGTVKLTFSNTRRFFLDEVLVVDATTDGVTSVSENVSSKQIYSLDGRRMGTDLEALGRGIYIMGGKKIVK